MEPHNEDEQPENNLGLIRSVRSDEKAYIRFINLTNATLEVLWVNFTGQYVRYQLLRRGAYVDINTYKTHPWIAVDVRTKDRMLIDKQFVYMPKTFRDYIQNNPNVINPVVTEERRKVILITLPLYSLRYRALLAVRNFFKAADDVDELDLPKPLIDDLKCVINLRNKYVSTRIFTVS